MCKRSRRARIIAGALASTALAFTFLLPAASAQDESGVLKIGVDRNCVQVNGSQGNCTYQTADPAGYQGGVFQLGGDTKNIANPDQDLYQKQEATQIGGSAVVNIAGVKEIKSEPKVVAVSGEVTVIGPKQEVELFAPQIANSAPVVLGSITQGMSTGSSDTNGNTVTAITKSEGGFAGAFQSSSNDLQAYGDQKANNGTDLFSIGGDSGKAIAGDGGDVKGGGAGDGGLNLAFAANGNCASGGSATGGNADDAIAVSAAVALANAEVEDSGDSNTAGGDTNATSDDAYAKSSGGSAQASVLAASWQSQGGNSGGDVNVSGTGGAGGAATSGTAGTAGSNYFQPQPVNQNLLGGTNTQTASGTATGGTAGGSVAYGPALGGVSGNNAQGITMSGGTAVNALTVTPSISGNTYGSSGNVSNSGSATSTVTTTFTQSGTSTNNQTQTPTQTGSNSSTIGNQSATGGSQTGTATQNVSSGAQSAVSSNSTSTTLVDPKWGPR